MKKVLGITSLMLFGFVGISLAWNIGTRNVFAYRPGLICKVTSTNGIDDCFTLSNSTLANGDIVQVRTAEQLVNIEAAQQVSNEWSVALNNAN